MIEIFSFLIGIIGVLLIIVLDINNFRKDNYDPKLFSSNELFYGNWLSLIAYFGIIVPFVFMEQSDLKGIFMLLFILLFAMDKTILNIMLYKSKKVQFNIFETFIFDIISILISVMILIKIIL